MKRCILFLFFIPAIIFAAPLYSPTWGFRLHLPEGYEYVDGDGRDRFSFRGPGGAMFDIIVYDGTYANMNELVNDVNHRLQNRGNVDFFDYNGKQAAIIELSFGSAGGWALAIEMSPGIFLLALAYCPANRSELTLFHLSALDSIVPTNADLFYPGPIMAYSFPRGEPRQTALAGTGITALIYENDAEASQVLIEREFNILVHYVDAPNWREAWLRYYRMIYRDSFARIADAALALAQYFGAAGILTESDQRAFAQRALTYVQGFEYERNFAGSDFLNLVTAVTEGRGDCDNRAMLWAIILSKAGIHSAMMVSRYYSHAMGLANIAGPGARFEAFGINWLVAETTANVGIGLIDQEMSDPRYWLGIIFD